MDVTEAIARRCVWFCPMISGFQRIVRGTAISGHVACLDWTLANCAHQHQRSYRGLRSIGKTGGYDPALMTPSLSKPWRSYRGMFLALVLSR